MITVSDTIKRIVFTLVAFAGCLGVIWAYNATLYGVVFTNVSLGVALAVLMPLVAYVLILSLRNHLDERLWKEYEEFNKDMTRAKREVPL